MKITQQELNHLIFLSDVVIQGKKKGMMVETLQCLLYIVKSIEEIDLPEMVVEQMNQLIESIEADLRTENDRMQEIHHNLTQPNQRKPFG
jgi:Asp-tRNA(Asn)/Glu-tRNA(Gln) amidotransferase C subunit